MCNSSLKKLQQFIKHQNLPYILREGWKTGKMLKKRERERQITIINLVFCTNATRLSSIQVKYSLTHLSFHSKMSHDLHHLHQDQPPSKEKSMRTFGIYENCIQWMAIPQHKYPSFIQTVGGSFFNNRHINAPKDQPISKSGFKKVTKISLETFSHALTIYFCYYQMRVTISCLNRAAAVTVKVFLSFPEVKGSSLVLV